MDPVGKQSDLERHQHHDQPPPLTTPQHQMTIHEVIKPFYILSKLVGFSWFSLHGYKWKVEKCLHPTIMIVNVSLRLVHLVYTLITPSYAPKYSPITHKVRFAFLALIAGLPLVHILAGYWKRLAQSKVIAILDKFDQQISLSFDVPTRHLAHRRYVRIIMAIFCGLAPLLIFGTCFVSFFYDLWLQGRFSYTVMLSSGISLVNYTISFSHIVLVALAVLSRLSTLHSTTMALFLANSPSALNWRQRGDKVRQLRILYGLLVETVDEINNGFAFIGLACTTVCFVVLISTTFANYTAIMGEGVDGEDWKDTSPFLLINVVWCGFYNAFLITTISINGRIKEQVSSSTSSSDPSSRHPFPHPPVSLCVLGQGGKGMQSMSGMVFCRYNC